MQKKGQKNNNNCLASNISSKSYRMNNKIKMIKQNSKEIFFKRKKKAGSINKMQDLIKETFHKTNE